MRPPAQSIRGFVGAKNFQQSRDFYRDLGFEENLIGDTLTYFGVDERHGFYLQDYYVKDWVDNTMMFLEVESVEAWKEDLDRRDLVARFPNVRISDIKDETWGRVIYIHDPSGVLWHVATFTP